MRGVKMIWSEHYVRLKDGGNVRECVGWMNRENARSWCNRHGILFVDVSGVVLGVGEVGCGTNVSSGPMRRPREDSTANVQ